jgi:putative endonuclease
MMATTMQTGPSTREDPRRVLGRRGEELAAAHFSRLGFTELARNARTRHGEIDLIVFEPTQGTIVFVEVKTRRVSRVERSAHRIDPLEAVRWRKRMRLRKLASGWLADTTRPRPATCAIRFDAVGVLIDLRGRLVQLDHVEDAW